MTVQALRARAWLPPAIVVALATAAVLATAVAAGALGGGRSSTSAPPRMAGASKKRAVQAYGKLPLRFEANRGQTDSRVKFIARSAGYTLFLTPTESVLSLRKPSGHAKAANPSAGNGGRSTPAPASFAAVRMRLAGANPHPQIAGLTRLTGKSNYLIGRDAKAWHTGVPGFGSARYRNVYRGVDLVYHGTQGRLEYDFRVAPGADARQVAIDFSGTRRLSLNRRGDLVLRTPAGVLRQHRPVVYQQVHGVRRLVRGRFVVHGHRVEFRIGRYDHSRPLVIDPVLAYSTYLGGRGGDGGAAIAVDGSGSAYVAGSSGSADFPVSDGAYQTTRTGDPADIFEQDGFVTKLSPAGKLVYSTFLGGADGVKGIAVDSSGRAYVAGGTQSHAFPTTAGALQPKAPPSQGTAFVTVLKADGSGLVYSSYLGGRGSDGFESATGVAVDGSGRAYVTGNTGSPDFPTKAAPGSVGPLQSSLNGPADAFVAKLNPDAAGAGSLIYATYLGGGDSDSGAGIAVDQAGDAYVTGNTSSADFPTKNPLPGQGAAGGNGDGFVSKLSPTGSQLAYSTYLGGAGGEQVGAIAVDGSGDAYVTGSTTSDDFPTKDAFQAQRGSSDPYTNDAFVSELSAGGSAFVYSSYLGGKVDEQGNGIAVDGSGGAYVVGQADAPSTPSDSFPTVDPLAKPAAGNEAFVTRVKPGGSGLSFSSYFGGGGLFEYARAVAVDASGNAYLTGLSVSTDLPTRQPVQTRSASRGVGDRADVFVAKVAPSDPAAPLVTGLGRASGPPGTSLSITGHGFAGATAVRFGDVAADRFTVESNTHITAIAPVQGEGPVAVTVTTGQGTSPANPIADFTYAQGVWDLTGSLQVARSGEIATRLRDGTVLAAGGCCDANFNLVGTAERYDPSDGTWRTTGSMGTPRVNFTATLLTDGRVLVAGGQGGSNFATLATAELYDPARGTWTATDSMDQERQGATATLLPNGKVLVAAGADSNSNGLDSAEIYDPTTQRWGPAASLHVGRTDHTATMLRDGKVLLAGGCCGADNNALDSAEVYDPAADSWASTGSLVSGRSGHTATRLDDGRVLLAGGNSSFVSSQATAEVYDPAVGTFTAAGAMARPRKEAAATLLANGKVLVTGGFEGNNVVRNSAELYDPGSDRWGSAGLMSQYRGDFLQRLVFAMPLLNGKVLVGGDAQGAATTELYDPGVGTTEAAPSASAPAETRPTPSGAVVDRTAPVVSGFGLSSNPFRVGGQSTPLFGSAAALRHKRGTTFRYRLSEASRVRIVISRLRAGRRRAGRCVAPTRVLRHARKCIRITTKGTLTRTSHGGANTVAFSGRIGSRALRPGRYQASLTATDAGNNTSAPKTLTFTIARR